MHRKKRYFYFYNDYNWVCRDELEKYEDFITNNKIYEEDEYN